jgi:PAS domain S-box-containing protein
LKDNPLILAVDRNERNLELLAQFLGKEGYHQRVALTDSLPAKKLKMSRILILLEHTENRRLLSEWLGSKGDSQSRPYEVLLSDSEVREGYAVPLLDESFDLCILDGAALNHLWEWVQAKKKAEQPVFLPFLLITPRPDVKMITRHLWQSIDDLVTKPIEKLELQARVEVLLRSRRLSLELKVANEKLQHEITERNQTQEALIESEAKLSTLIQNSSDIIGILESDGTIKYKSPSTQALLGFSPEELEGRNHFELVHPEDYQKAKEQFQNGLNNPGNTQVSEYRFRHKDGSWHYLESKSNFIDSHVNQIVINSRDITERKQVEEEIQKALEKEKELIELKSRFISMVSHEIRTPLNVILASSQILERYSEKWSAEKKHDFFQRIKDSVVKMTEMLNDVLLIGKAEFGKKDFNPVQLDLKKFCGELVAEIKSIDDGKHKIAFVNKSQDTNAYVDKKLLRHSLINLLSNAVKYSPQGSTVHLELSCQDLEVIFKIKDEGIGIPVEDQDKLFESFHRASNAKNIPGTGLGLTVVKQSVDIHGGKIAVNSELGVGTTFTVTLPIQRPADK